MKKFERSPIVPGKYFGFVEVIETRKVCYHTSLIDAPTEDEARAILKERLAAGALLPMTVEERSVEITELRIKPQREEHQNKD